MLKLHLGHEACHNGGLRINSDHMGIFKVHRNLDTQPFFAFRLDLNSGHCGGRDRTPTPQPLSRCGGYTTRLKEQSCI